MVAPYTKRRGKIRFGAIQLSEIGIKIEPGHENAGFFVLIRKVRFDSKATKNNIHERSEGV